MRVRGEEYRLSLNPQYGHALLELELARRTGAELTWGTA